MNQEEKIFEVLIKGRMLIAENKFERNRVRAEGLKVKRVERPKKEKAG